MKNFISVIFGFTLLATSCTRAQNIAEKSITESTEDQMDTLPIHARMDEKARSLKTYLTQNKQFNQKTAILIDMRQHSGKYRLFVYDLDSMKIQSKGLVAHGSGSETDNPDSLIFSNIPNSYCTSLGKYKIGYAYTGSFGKSYKLHGLESTNNKAFERLVVLHRYSCVPDDEQLFPICNSLGCPMVSEQYFEELDTYIHGSSKPIILEIFY